MKKTIRLLILAVCTTAIFASCKKETKVEQDSDHFMTRFDLLSPGYPVPLNTDYNNSPQNVTINYDSIVFKRGGLYHFEGKLYIYARPSTPGVPSLYEMYMIVGPMFQEYNLCFGFTELVNPGGGVANPQFEMDIYLPPNTAIKIRKQLGSMVLTPGNAILQGHFGGYRKGN
jgi:hypothetical protein